MRALFVTVRMKPEYRDRILKGALEDGRGSRKDEPGCLRFDVFQATRIRSTSTKFTGTMQRSKHTARRPTTPPGATCRPTGSSAKRRSSSVAR